MDYVRVVFIYDGFWDVADYIGGNPSVVIFNKDVKLKQLIKSIFE